MKINLKIIIGLILLAMVLMSNSCSPEDEAAPPPGTEEYSATVGNPDSLAALAAAEEAGEPDFTFEQKTESAPAPKLTEAEKQAKAGQHRVKKKGYVLELMQTQAELFDRSGDEQPWLAASYVLRTKTGVYKPKKNGGVNMKDLIDSMLRYVYFRSLSADSDYRDFAIQARSDYMAAKMKLPLKGPHVENVQILEEVCDQLYPDPGFIKNDPRTQVF